MGVARQFDAERLNVVGYVQKQLATALYGSPRNGGVVVGGRR